MTPQREPEVANLEAERQLLGRLLLDNDYYWTVAPVISPEHFATRVHADIFEKMGELIRAEKPANPVTLKQFISYDINHQPPQRYLLALTSDATSIVNLMDYAQTIVGLSVRRDIITGAQTIMESAAQLEISVPVEKVLEQADLTFAHVRQSLPESPRDTTSIQAVGEESLARLVELTQSKINPHPSLGIKGVTGLIGNLTPGCVYVLAGRPGSGKTAAAVAAARSILRQKAPSGEPFGVAFFTLEVTKYDLWNRFISAEMALSRTPVFYMQLKRGTVSPAVLKSIEYFSNAFSRFPLSIFDKSGVTVAEIFVKARALKRELEEKGQSLNVLVVDYLQIIKPTGRYAGNKVAEISEISSSLLQLAKDLNVAVIAVSQLSRKVEERPDKRPQMSDLRESGQIEQDANSIIFLYRPAYYDRQNTENASPSELEMFQAREHDLHYIVSKARDGLTGEVIAHCDIGKNHIIDKRR